MGHYQPPPLIWGVCCRYPDLWLVNADHMTWILASDWSIKRWGVCFRVCVCVGLCLHPGQCSPKQIVIERFINKTRYFRIRLSDKVSTREMREQNIFKIRARRMKIEEWGLRDLEPDEQTNEEFLELMTEPIINLPHMLIDFILEQVSCCFAEKNWLDNLFKDNSKN